MKKKLLAITFLCIFVLPTTACSNSAKNSNESAEKDAKIEALQSENAELKKQLDELQSSAKEQEVKESKTKDFDINDLAFDLSIVPSNNWVQISGTYMNNSDYTITQMIVTFTDNTTNNIVYWGTYDTVLPGETSPISEGDSIDNMDTKMESITPTKYSIDAKSPDGNNVRITYDVKLDEYRMNDR